MSKKAFTNGKIMDFITGQLETRNLLLSNKVLVGAGYTPDENEDEVKEYNIKGAWIIPHPMDLGANLREPGEEGRETIVSGSEAAINGGITCIACSPYVDHILDSPERISYMCESAKREGKVPIFPLGTLTKGAEGQVLSEMALMVKEGVVGFSVYPTVMSDSMLKNAFIYASMLQVPVIIEPHFDSQAGKAVMNKGPLATMLGLRGCSTTGEERIIRRVVSISKSIKGLKVHFMYVSAKESVEFIREAKSEGISITCGTAPHYFSLTDNEVDGYNTQMKVFPPLRTLEDVQAIVEGLKDGTIDVISSQHLPCAVEDKRTDFISAQFGASGLDAMIPLIVTKLIHEFKMDPIDAFRKLSVNPYLVLNRKPPAIALSTKPSFSVIYPDETFTFSPDKMKSTGKNSPYLGRELKGKVAYTVVAGHTYSL